MTTAPATVRDGPAPRPARATGIGPINVKYVDRAKWRRFVRRADELGIAVGDLLNQYLDRWLREEQR